jgi:SAM-dependent methyltransferase
MEIFSAEEIKNRKAQRRAFYITQADGFDEEYGIETEKLITDLNYGAIRVSVFNEIVDVLPTPISEPLVFVDIGSGKGKTVLLAALRSFPKIVGVEIDTSLCSLARQNIAIASQKIPNTEKIHIECMNALDWVEQKWPTQKDVFMFMYRPFPARNPLYPVFFDKVAQKAQAAGTNLTLAFVCPFVYVETLLAERDFEIIAENKVKHSFPASELYCWRLFKFDKK